MAVQRAYLALFSFSSLFLVVASQLPATVYVNCTINVTWLSPTFSRNLDTALQNLTSLSSRGTKYATTTQGSGAHMVYAIFQCRGDLSPQSCLHCMQNATVRLPQRDCPVSVGARIQLDDCYLRYDNQSFFVLDTSFIMSWCSLAKTTDPVVLSTIKTLVTNLAPKQDGFASANTGAEYAVAQCLGYLNETQCSQCLSTSYSGHSFMCNSAIGEQVHLASCYYRVEAYRFFGAPSPLPAALATAPPTSRNIMIIVGAVVGVALCVLLFMWRYKVLKQAKKPATWPPQAFLQAKAHVFSFQELEKATGHFHPTNKLGAGGFGVVYKGILSSGEHVAVKRLYIERQEDEGKEEFLNEVNLITNVQHKNLIRLLGCCLEGRERILVYEYLPNKSLDFSLFGGNMKLDWVTRYGIVLGMAKGLAYLHEESHIRIIHRDIKPGNVLLDDRLDPVIADFGIAKLVKENATDVNTRVAGTVGYVAPEYALHGKFSEKVDVFSFGMVSLEVCTGKKNRHSSLLTWAWENYQDGKALYLVDEKLGHGFCPEEALRVIQVALLCTQENPKQRPSMTQVTRWLSQTSTILKVPIRPTFLIYNDMGDVNYLAESSLCDRRVSQFCEQSQSLSEVYPR